MTQFNHSDPGGTASPGPLPHSSPGSWNEALSALLTARATILQAEAKIAGKNAVFSLLKWIAAGVLLLFAWLLLVAGIIASLVLAMDWPLHWVILGASLTHLIVAAILMAAAKSKQQSYFPITRAEFTKDSEWLKNFHKSKSND